MFAKTIIRNYSTAKPLSVLRLGPTRFAQEAWTELINKYEINIVETNSSCRDEFIDELKSGKYSNVDYITRTFESYKQTGFLDKELLKLIKENTKIKAISHNGAGYDQVDAIECGKLGIQLFNVPNLVDNATADTAVYLLIGAMRNFQLSSENLKKELWKTKKCAETPIGNDPEGKVLGILGMGGIGRTIRDRLLPFGFKKILYHNRNQLSENIENGAIYCKTVKELFKESDVLSISIPLNKNTKHLINENTINQMKDGVIIINTARGPIVDESALKVALKSGKVKAFGSDVWENEPNVDMELINLPNVTSLPHMGTHTMETMKAMEEFVVKNVEEYVNTGRVLSIVPELKDYKF
jgi:gluconate 2-dehydrogenase